MISNLKIILIFHEIKFCHYDFCCELPDCRHLHYDFCWNHPDSFHITSSLFLTLSTKRRWVVGSAHIFTNLSSGSSFCSFQGNTKFYLYFSTPRPLKAFVHMHSFTPQSAMMPEVRALPTPWRANTTCCHSNKTRSQMQPLHLAPFSPPLYYLYWFLLVYLPFFALSWQKRKGPKWCLSIVIAVSTCALVSMLQNTSSLCSCSHMDWFVCP